MIKNSCDVPTRRILSFPAIRPCESASPATLLSSLITLAHTICHYKSKPFSTNARNAMESIRLVQNLLIFLEDVENGTHKVSGSIVLSLSELHFIFQKVVFLLQDCTSGDARVLMAMKSEKVSSQFRGLVRAIGVALDVLPLDSIVVDGSIEVKELVGLVKKQCLTANLDFRSEDKRVVEIIRLILGQFENGMIPDSNDLRSVLRDLGISSWSECNKEIKFLDCEIGLERMTTEKKDLVIFNSLMGFLIYCRCTLFDVIDSGRPSTSDQGSDGINVIKYLNVDDLRCPISLELMVDPVTISTGQTYDRSSIQKWFDAGNHTCPKTGEKVTSTTNLVPNLALKSLIMQYCVENGIPVVESGSAQKRDITRTVVAGSVAAGEAMKMAANYLVCTLIAGTSEEKNKAAYEIRLLTKTSIFNRSCLLEAGVIPSLLDLLCLKDPFCQENAIAALLNLSKFSKSKRILVENDGLEVVLDVIKNGLKMEARQHAAGTLFYLASVEEYQIMIGKIPSTMPVLMELIVEGSDRGKKNALVAVFGLLMHSENHWRALAAGVVPLLINLLGTSDQREDLVTDSLAVLATLAEQVEGAMVILESGALKTIVGVFGSCSSTAAKEYCVSLLLALCINSGADVVPLLEKNPSLMGPLYSLLTEGSSRAGKKASSLIRLLHEYNEKRSSDLRRPSPVIVHGRFIHAW